MAQLNTRFSEPQHDAEPMRRGRARRVNREGREVQGEKLREEKSAAMQKALDGLVRLWELRGFERRRRVIAEERRAEKRWRQREVERRRRRRAAKEKRRREEHMLMREELEVMYRL